MELATVQSRAGDICCHFCAEEKGQNGLFFKFYYFCVYKLKLDPLSKECKSHT